MLCYLCFVMWCVLYWAVSEKWFYVLGYYVTRSRF